MFSVMAMLCLSFSTKAQQQMPTVGDKIPELIFDQILNFPSTSATLNTFKGKALIIEFWATWCGGCIKGFPRLDSLQSTYAKNLQILLINNSNRDDVAKINNFLARFKQDWPAFSLPLIVGNNTTRQLYGKGSLPHYIWVGDDRKIKAITIADAISGKNIERLIAGLNLNLPIKEANHEK